MGVSLKSSLVSDRFNPSCIWESLLNQLAIEARTKIRRGG